jgi:transposase InsO family protein
VIDLDFRPQESECVLTPSSAQFLRRPGVLDTIANENKEEMRHGASSVERAASLRIAHDSGQTIPGRAGGEGQLSAGKQGNRETGARVRHTLRTDTNGLDTTAPASREQAAETVQAKRKPAAAQASLSDSATATVQSEPLSRRDLAKGYEFEKGRYVCLHSNELAGLLLPTAREIDVREFVNPVEVEPVFIDSTFFVVPDRAGQRAYALLLEALCGSGLVGVAQIAMHSRESVLLTDIDSGALRDQKYLLHDGDTKFCAGFRSILRDGGVEPLRLPPRSPNLNAHAERWVRSVKEECLSRLILFGEASLRRALNEYVAHFHSERNHQGKGNILLFPQPGDTRKAGPVECSQRLGGLLRYYGRAA